MRTPIVLMTALVLSLTTFALAPAPAQAQSREQRAKGQACQWCKDPIDPEDYRTPPGAPYQMYCSDECIASWRKENQVESTNYLTPIFGGLAVLIFVVGGVVYLRGKQQDPGGPRASEMMRQKAAMGRAPSTTSLGTAHFRCTGCGRNLASANNCTYCGAEVEPIS